MTLTVTPETLKDLREQHAAFALIDVREYGEFNLAHIPGATCVPRRLLEFRIRRLVPSKRARIVLCDDNGARAGLAAVTLKEMGYESIAILQGGVNLWASRDFPTQWGMNVLSKRFAEHLQNDHRVPTIDAADLHQMVEQGKEIVILDTRTPEEYHQHCVPGARSMPGAELALRVADVRKNSPDATIVVSCAGRTRSIVGTRLLQRMGMPEVIGLRNGTSGWVLAGFQLEEGASRLDLPQASKEGIAAAEAFARRIADEDGVRSLSIAALEAVLQSPTDKCVYLIDVRTAAEYDDGHIPGFWHFPGGQAVQRADDAVAIDDGMIIFCCDGIVRSTVTASWFRQMGFRNVYAVAGGTAACAPPGGRWSREAKNAIRPEQAPRLIVHGLRQPNWVPDYRKNIGTTFFNIGTSREFSHGHIPGARWLSRSWLELRIRDMAPDLDSPIVVTDPDGSAVALAAAALSKLGYRNVCALRDGMIGWRNANHPVERGLSGVLITPNDVVPPPTGPERSYADMINYLRWEELLAK